MKHSVLRLSMLVASLVMVGCSDPCRDYCERFVERANDCGLGGPRATDSFLDYCAEEVSRTVSDDKCESVTADINSMSCMEFVGIVCQEPSASSAFNCPSG